jgi:hypothetical protein
MIRRFLAGAVFLGQNVGAGRKNQIALPAKAGMRGRQRVVFEGVFPIPPGAGAGWDVGF